MQYPLTENAIMHISAGFEGPYVLQAFGVKKQFNNPHQVNMCLTDGQIYIGAIYHTQKSVELENYNVVRITAQYYDRAKPILVKNLQILSKAHRKLIGSPPSTLVDYFNKQAHFVPQSQPRKKPKLNPDQPIPIVNLQSPKQSQKKIQPIKQEKPSPVNRNGQNGHKKLNSNNQISQSQKIHKKLRLAQDSDIEEIQNISSSPDNFKATFIRQQTRNSVTPKNMEQLEQNSYVRDLFQRHTGWVMLCRVNYRSLARCQSGLFAVNFVIQDSIGDQIKCVYFQGSNDRAKQVLKVGRYYYFCGGEIKLGKDEDLQIIFDRNAQFMQKEDAQFNVNPKKMTRIDRIMQVLPQHQINVIGVVRKIKNRGQLIKTKKKYTATICDPTTNYEIDFLLFLNQDQKPIQRGMIIVLHNYQVYRQGNICRLNSTYRSYYFEQKPTKDSPNDLVNQFWKILQDPTWDNENYKNISMFAFTQRSIYQLKNIYKKTDDDKIYSSVDCWVMQISKKKNYYACKYCKKPTEKKEMGLYQCSNCKKMVQVTLTYTLSVTFTDYTGSCVIDVIGQHAQNLLQKKALQYFSLSPEEQTNYLESLRFKNVQLRLKTQKKNDNKLAHSVWGIEKTTPQTSLKEIRKILHQRDLKFDQQW